MRGFPFLLHENDLRKKFEIDFMDFIELISSLFWFFEIVMQGLAGLFKTSKRKCVFLNFLDSYWLWRHIVWCKSAYFIGAWKSGMMFSFSSVSLPFDSISISVTNLLDDIVLIWSFSNHIK